MLTFTNGSQPYVSDFNVIGEECQISRRADTKKCVVLKLSDFSRKFLVHFVVLSGSENGVF